MSGAEDPLLLRSVGGGGGRQEAEPWLGAGEEPWPQLDLLPELSRMKRNWERERALSSARAQVLLHLTPKASLCHVASPWENTDPG